MIKKILCLSLTFIAFSAYALELKKVQISNPTDVDYVELKVDLKAKFNNPFNYDEVSLVALITSPSGKRFVVDGFYYRPFSRSLVGDQEVLTPSGKDEWHIRFTPRETGRYSYILTLKDLEGKIATPEYSLTLERKRNSPIRFVKVNPENKRFFVSENGTPFFPIGQNLCWSQNLNLEENPNQEIVPIKKTYSFDEWLPKMSEQKANYIRVWAGPFDEFTLERMPIASADDSGLLRYDQRGAWRLDYIFNLSYKLGIQIQLALDSFGSLKSGEYFTYWQKNPYSKKLGGMLNRPEEFFTSSLAKKVYTNRLRYLVARYGYASNLFAWEFFNEIDLSDNFNIPNVTSWHKEMANFLRSIDPYKHMIATSFAKSEGVKEMDELPELDFTQTHAYQINDEAEAVEKWNLFKDRFNKPHFLGEFGIDWSDNSEKYRIDNTGINLHNSLWSSMMTLSSASSMTWWWNTYVDKFDLYYHFYPLAQFSREIPWGAKDYKRLSDYAFTFKTRNSPEEKFFIEPEADSFERSNANRPNTFEVFSNGVVSQKELLSHVLHGKKNHPELYNPQTLIFNATKPGKFTVSVESVSGWGGAHLKIYKNGVLVLAKNMTEGQTPNHGTVTQYNGAYSIDIEPGKQVIQVVNDGADWLYLHYEIEGVYNWNFPMGDRLRLQGFTVNSTKAYAWIQNKDSTWYKRAFQKKAPRKISSVTLKMKGLFDGNYLMSLFNTDEGRFFKTEIVAVKNGEAQITLPEFTTDFALKMEKQLKK